MATSLDFYTDSALTTSAGTFDVNHLVDGTGDPQDFLYYLGSTETANKFQANSDPGVDQIAISLSAINPDWVAATGKSAGDRVVPTTPNGYKYEAQGVGTTHASTEPTWPTTKGDTVVDNDITWENVGEVHVVTEFKLALSSGGLGTAVAGDPLDVGTQITGGTTNAVPIYVRIDDTTASINSGSDIRSITNTVLETPI